RSPARSAWRSGMRLSASRTRWGRMLTSRPSIADAPSREDDRLPSSDAGNPAHPLSRPAVLIDGYARQGTASFLSIAAADFRALCCPCAADAAFAFTANGNGFAAHDGPRPSSPSRTFVGG